MAGPSLEEITAARKELGIDSEKMPKSIAIIMDGNGRWAQQRGLPRTAGHIEGAKTVRKIVKEAARLGIESLTLYSFSIENWNRPKDEVQALMGLYAEYLVLERPTVQENNIRLVHLGRREGLPETVLTELDEAIKQSNKNTGMFLCLALNYGSRSEMADALKLIAEKVTQGKINPSDIDEQLISNSLDTANVPDPDLLVRTSGEMRLSNFLLWQLSYSEFYVTDANWPDFDEKQLHKAILAYSNRDRRFGGLNNPE